MQNGEAEDMSTGTTRSYPEFEECEFGITDCGKHRHCVVWGPRSNSGSCECEPGFREDKQGNCLVNQDCEVGVTNCGKNRKCVPAGSRSKTGACSCVEGYMETDDWDCVEEKSVTVKTTKDTITPGVSKDNLGEVTPSPPQLPDTTTIKGN